MTDRTDSEDFDDDYVEGPVEVIDFRNAGIAELARLARVPEDDPGVTKFAKLVARKCVVVGTALESTGNLAWVPDHVIRAVTEQVSRRILSALDAYADPVPADAGWFEATSQEMLTLEPRLAGDDAWEMARLDWVSRFADRLHELNPGRSPDDCEAIAEEEAPRLIAHEPGFAATLWFNEDARAAT